MIAALDFSGRVDTVREPLQNAGVTCFDAPNPAADIVITDSLSQTALQYAGEDTPIIYRPRTDYLKLWKARVAGGVRGRLRARLLLSKYDGLIAPDEFVADSLTAYLNGGAVSSSIGVPKDLARYPSKTSHEGVENLTLLTLTNLDYMRKTYPLVERFAAVETWCAANDSEWVIAGDGTYSGTIHEMLKTGEYPHIKYVGYVDAPKWLDRADAILHFSELDIQYPNAVLEAMAVGLPVVTNRYAPFVQSTALTAESDEELLSILVGLEHPDVRDRLGRENRQYVADHHAPTEIGRELLGVMEEVMA